MQTKTVKNCSFHPQEVGGGGVGDFIIHGKDLVRTFVDVGDLFLGALDAECSWRLQSEGEPDIQRGLWCEGQDCTNYNTNSCP